VSVFLEPFARTTSKLEFHRLGQPGLMELVRHYTHFQCLARNRQGDTVPAGEVLIFVEGNCCQTLEFAA
jgi:hypothetical protein